MKPHHAHLDTKATAITKLQSRLQWVDDELVGKQYLMGNIFTVADEYLFTVTNWPQPVGLDLSPYTKLPAYCARVGVRPAVVVAMKAEGLLK